MRKSIHVSALALLLIVPHAIQAGGDPAAGKSKAAMCAGCHGMDGNSTNPMWPKLAGQHEAYLAKQIRAFKSGERNDPQMAPMMGVLSEADIDNVAAFFAAQKQK